MKPGDRQKLEREPSAPGGALGRSGVQSRGSGTEFDATVGSAEQLQATFAQAAAAADRAVGLWLARSPEYMRAQELGPHDSAGAPSDLRALRALVRAAATAYARRLRNEGATPERMLVLVKAATSVHGTTGFGAQELTNDLVRWSIEAYFDGS